MIALVLISPVLRVRGNLDSVIMCSILSPCVFLFLVSAAK